MVASGWLTSCAGWQPPRMEPAARAAEATTTGVADACARAVEQDAWTAAADACRDVPAADLDRAGLVPRLSQGYLGEGRTALSAGDVGGALAWFERARDQRPGDPEANRELALALAYRAGEATLAAQDWDDAVTKFTAIASADPLYLAWQPTLTPKRRAAEAQVRWAQTLLAERDLDEAERHCLAARALDARFGDAAECLDAVRALRTPTPTPTSTPAPTRTLGRLPAGGAAPRATAAPGTTPAAAVPPAVPPALPPRLAPDRPPPVPTAAAQ